MIYSRNWTIINKCSCPAGAQSLPRYALCGKFSIKTGQLFSYDSVRCWRSIGVVKKTSDCRTLFCCNTYAAMLFAEHYYDKRYNLITTSCSRKWNVLIGSIQARKAVFGEMTIPNGRGWFTMNHPLSIGWQCYNTLLWLVSVFIRQTLPLFGAQIKSFGGSLWPKIAAAPILNALLL
jgi:hypothetical protein